MSIIIWPKAWIVFLCLLTQADTRLDTPSEISLVRRQEDVIWLNKLIGSLEVSPAFKAAVIDISKKAISDYDEMIESVKSGRAGFAGKADVTSVTIIDQLMAEGHYAEDLKIFSKAIPSPRYRMLKLIANLRTRSRIDFFTQRYSDKSLAALQFIVDDATKLWSLQTSSTSLTEDEINNYDQLLRQRQVIWREKFPESLASDDASLWEFVKSQIANALIRPL